MDVDNLEGRELDALVAEKVMGWTRSNRDYSSLCWNTPNGLVTWEPTSFGSFKPSTDIAAAWEVVEAVQRSHEGWRFSLLGGDKQMGYRVDDDGKFIRTIDGSLSVVESSRFPFGWIAEFFGESDPRQSYGQRHGSAHASTAPLAICRAAIRAVLG